MTHAPPQHQPGAPTLDVLLRARLREGDDSPAVLEGGTGRSVTWSEIAAGAEALAAALETAGLSSAATLAVRVDNAAPSVGALIATVASGRTVLAIPAYLPRMAVDRVCELVHPDAWVTNLTDLRQGTGLRRRHERTAPGHPPSTPTGAPRRRLIVMSSGTTGPPKPVPLDDAQLITSLRATRRAATQRPRHASLLAHPAAHVAGLWTILGAVLSSSHLVLLPRFETAGWSRAVREHQVRATFLVPTALRELLHAEVPAGDLGSLALISTGAAACPATWIDAFSARFGVPVLSTYGATEFAGAIAGWSRDLHRSWWHLKRGSVGRAYAGTALRVVDEAGQVLPTGSPGRLEVRSSQTGQRWVTTSDSATLDGDGFLWVHGRLDRAISRGGFTVVPEVVEEVLRELPGASDAVVYAREDPRLGEVPCARVEFIGTPPGLQEVLAHCRERLPAYQVPAEIAFGAVARSPAGKLVQQL